eukprot:7245227-Pyramimonas_sp.AAC.1
MQRHIRELVEMNKEMVEKVSEATKRATTADVAGQEKQQEYVKNVTELRQILAQQQYGQDGKNKQMQDTTIQACAQMRKTQEERRQEKEEMECRLRQGEDARRREIQAMQEQRRKEAAEM